MTPGRCRFCRCSYREPCPAGCAWADAAHTLCTACAPIETAWRTLPNGRAPGMRRAFFRGWVTGAGDVERQETFHYRDRTTHRYYRHGFAAGADFLGRETGRHTAARRAAARAAARRA